MGEFSKMRANEVEGRLLSNQDCGGRLDFAQKVHGFGFCVWLWDMLFCLRHFPFFFFLAIAES